MGRWGGGLLGPDLGQTAPPCGCGSCDNRFPSKSPDGVDAGATCGLGSRAHHVCRLLWAGAGHQLRPGFRGTRNGPCPQRRMVAVSSHPGHHLAGTSHLAPPPGVCAAPPGWETVQTKLAALVCAHPSTTASLGWGRSPFPDPRPLPVLCVTCAGCTLPWKCPRPACTSSQQQRRGGSCEEEAVHPGSRGAEVQGQGQLESCAMSKCRARRGGAQRPCPQPQEGRRAPALCAARSPLREVHEEGLGGACCPALRWQNNRRLFHSSHVFPGPTLNSTQFSPNNSTERELPGAPGK